MSQTNTTQAPWSPLYFLSSLGAGGLIVTFFMFLLFWVPHPDQAIPVFEDILAAFTSGTIMMKTGIIIATSGILFFAIRHFQLLAWNFSHYRQWKADGGLSALEGSNAHTQMLAIPLTLAMSINAGFMLGAMFVPQLWSVVEMLFPLAMAGFLALGVWALKLYLHFFSQMLSEKKFQVTANASLAQLLPGFAFAMITVGLSAPVAMSHNHITVGVSIVLAGFFFIPAVFITLLKLIIGIGHMLEHGANRAALPTLWVGIPILTTLTIAALRLDHGLSHTLGLSESTTPLMFLTIMFSAQLFLILLGAAVMKRMGYIRSVLKGEEQTPVVFALICPGVSISIMMHFLINKGLVAAGLVTKFGIAYWSFTALAIIVQLLSIWLLMRLTRKMICKACPLPSLAIA